VKPHRRALTLIALSVAVILATGLAYMHPPASPQPKGTGPAPTSQRLPARLSIDPGPLRTPPLTELFRSPAMHYSIKFPAGWTAMPASQTWHTEWDTSGKPNVDELDGTSVVFTGASAPLASGQSPANWIASYLATAATNHCGLQEYMDFLGLVGLIYLGGCTSADVPGLVYNAAVVIGGRGYSFSLKGKAGQELFVSMLRTINFAT
jgi:hypothetical protein